MRELTKLLADLVAIPSVNPMGREVSGPQYLEENIGDYVFQYLRRIGVDVEKQLVFPRRSNIIGHINVRAKETILVEAHLDTVPVENMTIDPFDPVVRNGRLCGRGSCDTKASLAAILFTIKSLLNARERLTRNIMVAAVCDEEYGLSGTRVLLKRWKPDFAIVGEPTGLEIVNCHKGVMRWRICTLGKSAHSAYPQQGVNAIFGMAAVLNGLEKHNEKLMRGKRHPMLGTATLSVGIIQGGQSVNTVPNLCTIEIDRRTLPDETSDSVLEMVKKALPKSVRWRVTRPYLTVPSLSDKINRSLVKLLRDAISKCGQKPRVHGARYVTDASLYAAKGIPSVVFGPGRIEQAHAEVEYVYLEEVEAAARVYSALLTSP